MHDAKVQFQKITAAYERLTSEGHLSDEDSDEEGGFGWDFDEDAYYQAEDHFCNIWCVNQMIEANACTSFMQSHCSTGLLWTFAKRPSQQTY